MRRFELAQPATVGEACAILAADPSARPIAGGTALLILIKLGLVRPGLLVSLRKLHPPAGITWTPAEGARIAAQCTLQEVVDSPIVREHYPILARACEVVANIRIRNAATIGGNLAHVDPQSDPPPALLALEARIEISGVTSTRTSPLADFLRGAYETDLRPGEIVTGILLPPPPAGSRSTYLKFTSRSSEDRPLASLATVVRVSEGVCQDVRIAVGAAAAVPKRMRGAEEKLRGRPLEQPLVAEVADLVAADIEPIEDLNGDQRYKRAVIRSLVLRALDPAESEGTPST
ncbi:MAG TPA: xanthine dehydrogenase family protein subunit M [Candidatus Dormibacteraeota bacterium]